MALAAPLAAFVLGFSGVAKLRNQRTDVLRLRMGDLSIVGHKLCHTIIPPILASASFYPLVLHIHQLWRILKELPLRGLMRRRVGSAHFERVSPLNAPRAPVSVNDTGLESLHSRVGTWKMAREREEKTTCTHNFHRQFDFF